jgi:hypothetical protein
MVINVQDMLALFKSLTNFILVEFDKLATLLVLKIKNHVKSTNEHIITFLLPITRLVWFVWLELSIFKFDLLC